jgi:hypothetical protein
VSVGLFNYFARVVPTTYVSYNGSVTRTYQYSVTEYFKMYNPSEYESPCMRLYIFFCNLFIFFLAININYDLSPLRVIYHEHKHPLSMLQFLTSLCAIIGGVFTVGKIIDLALFNIHTYTVKKRIGKAS